MAYCQSYFIWSQTEKIHATVKYFSKKLTKIFPSGASLHLHCTNNAMISSSHLCPFITTEVEHCISLGCQRTNRTLCKIVINRKVAVLKKSKDVVPKFVKIIQGQFVKTSRPLETFLPILLYHFDLNHLALIYYQSSSFLLSLKKEAKYHSHSYKEQI